MSYISITSDEIAIGEPIKNSTLVKIKDNFTDLKTNVETLVTAVETLSTIFPMYFHFSGYTDTITDEHFSVLKNNFTINAAELTIKTAGSSGTTEVDVLYKRGAGAWTSIFSTKPSVVYSAGNYITSTNAVLSTTNLLSGDLIRCSLVTSQVDSKDCVLLLVPGI